MKTEIRSEKEKAPAVVGSGAVVRPRHPWQQWDARKAKLKEARALAARRRELKWHKEHDDELTVALVRQRRRIKTGIPVELPIMKPWDHAKGRVA